MMNRRRQSWHRSMRGAVGGCRDDTRPARPVRTTSKMKVGTEPRGLENQRTMPLAASRGSDNHCPTWHQSRVSQGRDDRPRSGGRRAVCAQAAIGRASHLLAPVNLVGRWDAYRRPPKGPSPYNRRIAARTAPWPMKAVSLPLSHLVGRRRGMNRAVDWPRLVPPRVPPAARASLARRAPGARRITACCRRGMARVCEYAIRPSVRQAFQPRCRRHPGRGRRPIPRRH